MLFSFLLYVYFTQDIRAPSASPLLADDDPSGSIKHYFLAGLHVASQNHLRHLVSPGRFAFCSAPLPDLRTMVRMPRPTSYQELQTCLRRTLVADPAAEPESEPGLATEAAPPAWRPGQAQVWRLLASQGPMAPCSSCAMPALLTGARLPAGTRTLAGLRAPLVPACALAFASHR